MPWIQNSAETIIDRSFRHCRQGRSFLIYHCDVTTVDLWRHAKRDTSIVTLYSSIVLACANWRKSNHHWWITTVNIDFWPSGIHGLACKKICLKLYIKLSKRLWSFKLANIFRWVPWTLCFANHHNLALLITWRLFVIWRWQWKGISDSNIIIHKHEVLLPFICQSSE